MFATPAYAQTAAGAPGGFDLAAQLPQFGLPILLVALFYFMILRPQQKRAKDHQAMIMAVKRGDTVVMSSGMIGKVTKVEDAEVQVEIATGVVVKVVKSTLSDVRTRGEPAANDTKS
jgi:preprotein translocase subunit YajC